MKRTTRAYRKKLAATFILVGAMLFNLISAGCAHAATRLKVTAANFGSEFYRGQGAATGAKSKDVTITNSRKGLAISGLSMRVTGANSADFQITNNTCSSDLAVGANCKVTLSFNPGAIGRRRAMLALSDEASANAGQAALSGTGVRPKHLILPSSVNFGKVKIGQTSTKTVKLSNPNPVAVNIQSITASGPFQVQSLTCGASLASGASCRISVKFNPTPACDPLETGNLSVANDAADTPAVSKLMGIAVSNAQNAIFVANSVSSAVTAYPLSSSGNASAIASISDPLGLHNPGGLAIDSSGRIYVADSTSRSVSVYATGANGLLTSIAIIGGCATGLDFPSAVALDSGGNIYVTNGLGGSSLTGSITVYPPLGASTGTLDEAPTLTITGTDTGLAQPLGIALDSGGNIYAVNPSGGASGMGSVTIYAPVGGNSGTIDEAPLATIEGPTTGLGAPNGVALDSLGNIYVTNFPPGPASSDSVTIYKPLGSSTGTLDEAPIATISGAITPLGITLDSIGNIYVANQAGGPNESGSVTIYPPLGNSTGTLSPTPIATITGDNTELASPDAVLLDSEANIYVTNLYGGTAGGGSLTVYPPLGSSTGNLNETPVVSVGASNTGLDFPTGIAQDSQARLYVTNEFGGPSGIGSVTIYPALGSSIGTLNETPSAVIAGPKTDLFFPAAVTLDAAGNIYVVNDDLIDAVYFVTIYSPLGNSTGNLNVAIKDSIFGPDTGLNKPNGIALDSAGHIYVANQEGGATGLGSITEYPAGGGGDVAPIVTLTGQNTGLNNPTGVALDSAGNIYVANEFGGPSQIGSITVYAPFGSNNGNLDATPIATIVGLTTDLAFPQGIALDTNRNIYVVNDVFSLGFYTVTIYPPLGSSTGILNEAPSSFITGPDTGLAGPLGVVVGPVTPQH